MEKSYTPAELKAIAHVTASSVGCEAVGWWFSGRDRTRLYIKGKQVLPMERCWWSYLKPRCYGLR